MGKPITGLDYGNQIRLQEMITMLASQGYTFLKTTHHPDHAMMISTRVMAMKDGSPKEVITPERLGDIYNVDANDIPYKSDYWCIPTLKAHITDS